MPSNVCCFYVHSGSRGYKIQLYQKLSNANRIPWLAEWQRPEQRKPITLIFRQGGFSVNKESRFVRMCPCDTGNHQWGGLAWNRNVALWALNKSILNTNWLWPRKSLPFEMHNTIQFLVPGYYVAVCWKSKLRLHYSMRRETFCSPPLLPGHFNPTKIHGWQEYLNTPFWLDGPSFRPSPF